MLERHGFTVQTARTGEQAVELAEAEPFDLIIMDINLGKRSIDGTEAARRILAKRDLAVIFLTSHTEKEFVRRADEVSHAGYVLKNKGENALLKAIRAALETAGGDEDLES